MECLTKKVNDFQPLTIFAKNSILDVWQGSEYALLIWNTESNMNMGYLSCFAVVLRGIHRKVDICQTDYCIHSKLRIFLFFNCYLAAPRPILGYYRGDSLTHPMLMTAFYIFDPKITGSLVARSLSPVECLVGFEPGTFRFLLQRLNPLSHSPQSLKSYIEIQHSS